MDKLPPIPSPPGIAFREFRSRFLPGLVFAAVLAATVQVWRGYTGPAGLVGEVQTLRSVVNASVSGRLTQMPVVLFQSVRAGQVLGQITPVEPAVLDAQTALAKARMDQIRLNFDPALRKQNSDVSYAGLRMNWLEARIALAADLAKTNFLAGELDRAQRFQSGLGLTGVTPRVADPVTGFASMADVQRAQGAYDQALASIRERQRAIAEIGALLDHIAPEERRLDDEIPSGVRAAILVEERNLQLLESQLSPQTLLAPITGVVTTLNRRAGEHVQSGENLLTITADTARTIVAYGRQPLDPDIRPGRPIEVRARGVSRAAALANIQSVGPSLESIPSLMLPARAGGAAPEVGLPIILSVPPELSLRPGELVDLRFPD